MGAFAFSFYCYNFTIKMYDRILLSILGVVNFSRNIYEVVYKVGGSMKLLDNNVSMLLFPLWKTKVIFGVSWCLCSIVQKHKHLGAIFLIFKIVNVFATLAWKQ